MEPLFPSGTFEITPGAADALTAVGANPAMYFARHQSGDWGEEDEEIQQENAFALQLPETMQRDLDGLLCLIILAQKKSQS